MARVGRRLLWFTLIFTAILYLAVIPGLALAAMQGNSYWDTVAIFIAHTLTIGVFSDERLMSVGPRILLTVMGFVWWNFVLRIPEAWLQEAPPVYRILYSPKKEHYGKKKGPGAQT